MNDFTGGIFIGDDLQYQQFLKNNPEIKKELDKEKRSNLGKTETTTRISSSDMTPISEDDLNMIKRTRVRHDYETVYMQPDIKFYDRFYMDDSKDESRIPEDIVTKAKKIKRIYRGNYLKYMDACLARDEYIDALIDSYGGEELFELAFHSGRVKEWIPPVPKYAKTSMDYDMVMSGVIDTSDLTETKPELAMEVFESMDIKGEPVFTVGPVTNKVMNDNINAIINNEYHNNSRYKQYLNKAVINISESDILASFNTEMGYKTEVKNESSILLSETPEAFAEKYYLDGLTDASGKLTRARNGEDISTHNDNERVYDTATGKYMSKSEHDGREVVRQMAKNSDWSEHKLMCLFNIGTRSERERMEINARRNQKNKKKKSASMPESDIFGSDFSQFIDDLGIDDLMRGD